MVSLKSITLDHPINIGAPMPTILSNDNNLDLLFYVDLINYEGFPNKTVERNINDEGVIHLKFNLCQLFKFGTPSDENIIGHPYYNLGLKPYSFFIVENSDWIEGVKKVNSKHPYYNETNFNNLSHYILTFKDNTFECISKDYSSTFLLKSMKESFTKIANSFIQY